MRELVVNDALHIGNLVLGTEPSKQIVVSLFAGKVVKVPMAAAIQEL